MATTNGKKKGTAKRESPSGIAFSEPSARSGSVVWTPDTIRAAELLADQGNFTLAVSLCEAIFADDKVQGALTTLTGTITGLDVSFETSGDKRQSKKAARWLEAGEDWWKCFPEDELITNLSWCVTLGFAMARAPWAPDPDTGRVVGKVTFWHPQNLRWSTKKGWEAKVAKGDAEEWITITPGDGTWILLAPRGTRRPWMNGAWRAVARWWLLKDYAIRDWGAYSERHGTGTWVAEAKGSGMGVLAEVGNTKDVRKDLASSLNSLGRNSSIAMPPGWSLRLVEATANTFQTYEKQIGLADRGITLAFHGTNLTNEDNGSFARATVLNGVHIQVVKSITSALSTTAHDQVLVYWAEFNFGERTIAPWPAFAVEAPEDLKASADALGAVATACSTLVALSDRVDIEAILVKHKVPLLDDKALAKKLAEKPAPPPAPAPEPGAPVPSGRRPVALARHHGGGHPVAAAPAGVLAGQLYADDLADAARDGARGILRPDLDDVLADVAAAETYEGLRAALKTRFAGMDPAALAKHTARAVALAELGGRAAVAQDVNEDA